MGNILASDGFAIMRAVTTRAIGSVLLSMLLAGFLLLGALPNHLASIRFGGLSVLWWYGGVLAPVLAVLVAVRWLAGPPSAPPPNAQRQALRQAQRQE